MDKSAILAALTEALNVVIPDEVEKEITVPDTGTVSLGSEEMKTITDEMTALRNQVNELTSKLNESEKSLKETEVVEKKTKNEFLEALGLNRKDK